MQAKQSSVRALERGLDILECLQRSSVPLSLSVLAEKVSLSPSTAVRILSTLEKRGFIQRDSATKQYSLGPGAQMGKSADSFLEILSAVAEGPMEALSAAFGESISLYVPQKDKRVCLKRVESPHPLRQVVNVGDRLPISVGAGGKVLCAWLAAQSDLDPAQLVPPLAAEALRLVRENGFAASYGEREAGTFAVSAPVLNAGGKLAASLAVAGPIVRFDPEKLPMFSEAVMAQAAAISAALGWNGDNYAAE